MILFKINAIKDNQNSNNAIITINKKDYNYFSSDLRTTIDKFNKIFSDINIIKNILIKIIAAITNHNKNNYHTKQNYFINKDVLYNYYFIMEKQSIKNCIEGIYNNQIIKFKFRDNEELTNVKKIFIFLNEDKELREKIIDNFEKKEFNSEFINQFEKYLFLNAKEYLFLKGYYFFFNNNVKNKENVLMHNIFYVKNKEIILLEIFEELKLIHNKYSTLFKINISSDKLKRDYKNSNEITKNDNNFTFHLCIVIYKFNKILYIINKTKYILNKILLKIAGKIDSTKLSFYHHILRLKNQSIQDCIEGIYSTHIIKFKFRDNEELTNTEEIMNFLNKDKELREKIIDSFELLEFDLEFIEFILFYFSDNIKEFLEDYCFYRKNKIITIPELIKKLEELELLEKPECFSKL